MRLGFAAVGLAILGVAYFVFTGFYARYFTVLARAAPNPETYERNLVKALEFDPSYNWANLQMARVALRENKLGAARAYQEKTMQSHVSVAGLEQMGMVMNRLHQRKEAVAYFQQAVRVDPGNVAALEQLASFALEAGDDAELERLTAEILRYDLGNLNVFYLRARAADRVGNSRAALLNYQNISQALARGPAPRRFLGTKAEVEKRLRELKAAVADSK